ncbi:NUDIX hydrolase [Rapidithrix thailandica]|uniref:GDP-mannose pyrophosphatase n=1 Tax=Rapidithrix thailandica TaxID=413964 RepID=A0AAW9SBL4_9BACT
MKVTIKEENILFDDFLKIKEGKLQFERFDGSMSPEVRFLKGERGDSVTAIVWHKTRQKLLFTKQFRYPTFEKGPGWLVELVAGSMESGEDPQACILREVEEELGYKARQARLLHQFYSSPGGSSERMFLFYIEVTEEENTYNGGGLDTENEDIQLIEWSMEEVWQAYLQGEIQDAKTLIGILWLKMHTPTP